MMVPVVELRVWTLYPGQFPGQVTVENRMDYMLEDPKGLLSIRIKQGEELEKQLREIRFRTGLRNYLKEKWLLWVSKTASRKLFLLTKRALNGAVILLAEPIEKLEDYEKSRVLESISKATRLDFIARLAKKPFDDKTLTFVAFVSIISN